MLENDMDVIIRTRNWLRLFAQKEPSATKRSQITNARLWLEEFETIRCTALPYLRENVGLDQEPIRARGETEATHREFMIPIPDGPMPHMASVMSSARTVGFSAAEHILNINGPLFTTSAIT